MSHPAFIITIDTEGDNLWQNHDRITTENARYLPRFQQLCEKYGFKPVYLTNYEMASDPVYVEFAQDVIARGCGEVGMHLHAWNSPPEIPLTDNDWANKPYLIEYPAEVIQQKVDYMTHLLEDTFQTKMVSHRAGRWAMNAFYLQLLLAHGYQVDCSVTPRVDWRGARGAPQGNGGSDYSGYPDNAYFVDADDLRREGTSTLLEVPMSTRLKHAPLFNHLRGAYDRLRGKRRPASVQWLRPRGGNLQEMQRVAEYHLSQRRDYVEFMLHSSEFMPGGSPTFRNEQDIERLYHDLEALFDWLAPQVTGQTLAEYYQIKRGQRPAM
ncbi:deacetylase [Edwardsiella piscicida]|uniref:deacetylase n=1 Tax=Edwardsiella piscicida TaxID=1263550 RepID=UPI000D50A818|nr:deacetylase [Edwardsiella piscicida]EKS7793339.1 deacetylase [Edwardsiella piscicida]ELM3728430.1 deacetylase [Edwardsiella piscicida]ELV7535128.1 deacetylase [Edwardsiella piscicida]UCQ44583.1 deacetylase [Edwardsiella piscicida]